MYNSSALEGCVNLQYWIMHTENYEGSTVGELGRNTHANAYQLYKTTAGIAPTLYIVVATTSANNINIYSLAKAKNTYSTSTGAVMANEYLYGNYAGTKHAQYRGNDGEMYNLSELGYGDYIYAYD